MVLLKIFIVILHIFILTNSYELICKATKKEKYLFIFWVFIAQFTVETLLYFISLDGFGIEKISFTCIIFTYLIPRIDLKIKKNADKSTFFFIIVLKKLDILSV